MKNNMMKKLLTMTLACAMTLSLAACGSKAESSADSSADQNTAAPTETDTKAYKADPSAFKGAVGDVSMVVRVAVAGRQNAPDLQTVMGILGREKVLDRLEKCSAAL